MLKNLFAQIYYLLYRCGIKKNKIEVCSVDETIDELLQTNKSMVRFGDGDIVLISGHEEGSQRALPGIADSLIEILKYRYDDLMIAIPGVFEDLSIYGKKSQKFWKIHLLFERSNYEKYCCSGKKYYNSFISRFYYLFQDKSQCQKWVDKIKLIWKDKDIVVIEGGRTHNGVGNDLFQTARSVERIIGPSSDAYEVVDQIVDYCKQYPKDRVFLVSLGIAAKSLTQKLFLEGYRVIDIGQLDMEYEWYLSGTLDKVKLAKHDIIGDEANINAGYKEYVSQIRIKIGKQ